jgi:tetratricopeptide (TPR) repeat protein
VYALLLSTLGRSADSIREAQRALESDLLSPLVNAILGLAYAYARQFASAEEQFRKTLELDPNFGFAHWLFGGLCLAPMGRYEEGIAELQGGIRLSENVGLPTGFLGLAYAKAGRRDEALRVLEELDELAKHRYVSPLARAFVYMGLGDERMFEALEEAYRQRCPSLVWVGVYTFLDELRPNPRFQDLLRRMNFPTSISPSNGHSTVSRSFAVSDFRTFAN